MAARSDDNDPYPYQIDAKARDENMAKLILPARKRLTTMKAHNSPILSTVDDIKDSKHNLVFMCIYISLSLFIEILQKLPRCSGKRKVSL